jgi:hypothetical protein
VNVVKSAVRAFIEAAFGGPTTDQESVVLVGTTGNTRLVPNNAERVSLTFVNIDVNDVIIGLGPFVSTGGLRLVRSGGAINFIVRDDATLPGREWWAQSPVAPANVYILEVIRSIYTPPQESGITAQVG